MINKCPKFIIGNLEHRYCILRILLVCTNFIIPAPKAATAEFMKKIAEAQGSQGSDLIKHDVIKNMLIILRYSGDLKEDYVIVYSIVQYSIVQCSTVQYSAVQYRIV